MVCSGPLKSSLASSISATELHPAAMFSGVISSPVPNAKPMGLALGTGDDMTPENIAAGWSSVADMDDARELFSGPEQTIKILEQADKA